MVKIENNNKTTRNHYVPRGYLKFFENNSGHLIFYDKNIKCIEECNSSNVAIKKNLYNAKEYNKEVSWEDFYTNAVDKEFPKLIRELISYVKNPLIQKPLNMNNIKARLSVNVVLQLLRTPERIYSQREKYNERLDQIFRELEEKNININRKEIQEALEKYKKDEYYKGIMLRLINDKPRLKKYIAILLNKTWLLYYNNTNIEFITSDNPVILYNFIDKTVGLCNGIARSDTFIMMPLTPKFLLFIAPNYYMMGFLKKLYDNTLIKVDEISVVENCNYRQVENSMRQIYGNDYDLIKRYII